MCVRSGVDAEPVFGAREFATGKQGMKAVDEKLGVRLCIKDDELGWMQFDTNTPDCDVDALYYI